MRIRMKTQIAGPRDGADWPSIGGELDVPDDEGAALCANGMAEPVAVEEKSEKATPRKKAETRKSED